MKKLLLLSAIVVSTMTLSAQEANIGLSGALPIGDVGDITTFGLNLDANYLWEVSEQFDLGVAAGYHYYFGEDIDFGFLPIAAAARFNASEDFTIGADVGYALGINPDGNDGGFYYAPKIQYSVSEALDIVFAYKGVSLDGVSFDAISLGIEFGL
jgi:hypothetical protein